MEAMIAVEVEVFYPRWLSESSCSGFTLKASRRWICSPVPLPSQRRWLSTRESRCLGVRQAGHEYPFVFKARGQALSNWR